MEQWIVLQVAADGLLAAFGPYSFEQARAKRDDLNPQTTLTIVPLYPQG